MSMTLKELIDNPQLLEDLMVGRTKCCACHRLEEAFEEPWHQTSSGLMCDDCYYKAMGEEIEEHPLGGHIRRGAKRCL